MDIEKSYTKKIIDDIEAKQLAKMNHVKNKRVTARLTPAEYDKLNRACFDRGIKVSRFLEEALVIALNGLAV